MSRDPDSGEIEAEMTVRWWERWAWPVGWIVVGGMLVFLQRRWGSAGARGAHDTHGMNYFGAAALWCLAACGCLWVAWRTLRAGSWAVIGWGLVLAVCAVGAMDALGFFQSWIAVV